MEHLSSFAAGVRISFVEGIRPLSSFAADVRISFVEGVRPIFLANHDLVRGRIAHLLVRLGGLEIASASELTSNPPIGQRVRAFGASRRTSRRNWCSLYRESGKNRCYTYPPPKIYHILKSVYQP